MDAYRHRWIPSPEPQPVDWRAFGLKLALVFSFIGYLYRLHSERGTRHPLQETLSRRETLPQWETRCKPEMMRNVRYVDQLDLRGTYTVPVHRSVDEVRIVNVCYRVIIHPSNAER
jgi:hypothetical protein